MLVGFEFAYRKCYSKTQYERKKKHTHNTITSIKTNWFNKKQKAKFFIFVLLFFVSRKGKTSLYIIYNKGKSTSETY